MRQQHKRLPVADEELKRRYESSATVPALAQEYGWSYGTMHQRLREAGARFRCRGGARVRSGRSRAPHPALHGRAGVPALH